MPAGAGRELAKLPIYSKSLSGFANKNSGVAFVRQCVPLSGQKKIVNIFSDEDQLASCEACSFASTNPDSRDFRPSALSRDRDVGSVLFRVYARHLS